MIFAKNFFEPIFFKPIPKCSLRITYNRKNKTKIKTVTKGVGEGRKN